jgi:hypothetical protein
MVAQLASAAISRITAPVFIPAIQVARIGPICLTLGYAAFLVLSAGRAPVAPILLMGCKGASATETEAGSRPRTSHAAGHADGERMEHHHE